MPSNPNIRLESTRKRYAINGNQSIVVWTATSPQDPNFNIQLQFIQDNDNAKKMDFAWLLSNLEGSIKSLNITTSNELFFEKDDIKKFLDSLKNAGINPKSAQLTKDKKTLYKSVESGLFEESNKELLALLTTQETKTVNNKTLYFGYEISKELRSQTSSFDKGPINCVYIFNEQKTKQLINKVYLFPLDEASLEEAQKSIKAHLEEGSDINKLNLKIPFVIYDPKQSEKPHYDQDIQTRINLQAKIAETLIHLKQIRFFRTDNSAKIDIFTNLFNQIASSNSLNDIKNILALNEERITILKQHRDLLWGPFTFFKGNTHSLEAWKSLKEMLDKALPSHDNDNTQPSLACTL